ncbi:MAG: Glycosyl transferase group 1, partial [candidate division CPR1 bacterium GW2011_GWA2_42_17]
DFMQWGGAERLVLALSEMYPDAPIYCALYDERVLPVDFPKDRIVASGLQKHWLFKKIYRPFFFLHPLIFENFDLSGFDVVISSTTRFAKSIIVKPPAVHICYCNTPPRFLWNFNEYFRSKDMPPFIKALARIVLTPLVSYLRLVDETSAQRVDYFVANSQNVRQRIKKYYRRESVVIYPFVDLSRFVLRVLRGVPSQACEGTPRGGFYLIISRLSGHKKIDLAIQAFNELGLALKIVGDGSEFSKYRQMAKSNVELLGRLSDSRVTELLQNCKAFIYPQEEDFGITALEAMACGKPVIAFAKGGALETVIDGQTGLFFSEQTAESLKSAILWFENIDEVALNQWEIACRQRVKEFSKEIFENNIRAFVAEKVNKVYD